MKLLLALVALPAVLGQVDIAARPTPTCDRLPYKRHCDDLNVPSQFTLRYYVKDGKCCSYPFGWCPADETNLQAAIRTKEHCEAFCLNGAPANPEGGAGAGAGGQQGGNGGNGGSAGGNGGNGGWAGGNGGANGGYGSGAGNGGSSGSSGSGSPSAQGPSGGNGGPSSAGGNGFQDTSKPPVKTCDRQPFRDFCEVTQSVSQFTLRWYVRDGMCCSYPWGFCPGDELAFETSIRTKEECESFCLGQGGSGSSGSGSSGSGSSGSGSSGSGSSGSGSGSSHGGSGSSGSGSSGSSSSGSNGGSDQYSGNGSSGSGSSGSGSSGSASSPAPTLPAPAGPAASGSGYEAGSSSGGALPGDLTGTVDAPEPVLAASGIMPPIGGQNEPVVLASALPTGPEPAPAPAPTDSYKQPPPPPPQNYKA